MEPVEVILGHVLTESGYRDALAQSDDAEDEERLANIEELLTSAREFDRETPEGNYLEAFLEQISLVSDTDDWEEETDKVTLMTLHAAKGLEFPVVFIVAAEEGLMPHERSREDPAQLEEERRLLFVGITRGEEELEISLSQRREFRGSLRYSVPSQFLMELPREEMDVVEPGLSQGRRFGGRGDFADEFSQHAAEQYDESRTQAAVSRDRSEPAVESTSTTSRIGPLTTAAQLVENGPRRDVAADPEVFVLDMVVTHPEYGLGKIVALSGSREKRTATVQFATGAGQRKFRLDKSPLQPVKKT